MKNDKSIKINKLTDRECSLTFWHYPQYILSALRREMIKNVQTLSIDHVTIRKNNSSMNNYKLVHKLSMIPFVSEQLALKNITSFNTCLCGSVCKRCSYKLILKIEGNNTPIVVPVLSSHLVNDEYFNGSYYMKPAFDDILLCELVWGQEIYCDVYLKKGTGHYNI